jgi:hypothetical protein
VGGDHSPILDRRLKPSFFSAAYLSGVRGGTWEGSAMKLLFLVLCLLASLLFVSTRSRGQESQSQGPSGSGESERVLLLGKTIFVERCARCHDERGDKPLKSGPPLNERNLSDQEIARFVSGRLKDTPDAEKHAVALYVTSFMKRK